MVHSGSKLPCTNATQQGWQCLSLGSPSGIKVRKKRWAKKNRSFWVSISIWESLLIGDQQTFSSWALHENKKSYFLVIFKCFSLFWTMRMHVQPCVCWSKYTTDFTAAVLSLKWKVRKIILDSYLTTDVSSSSSCTVPEEEETDSKANDSKGHKGHTDNYDGDSEK